MPITGLRADPTRTILLRKKFLSDLRKRIRKLKGDILQLIDKEDAFGLRGAGRINFNKRVRRRIRTSNGITLLHVPDIPFPLLVDSSPERVTGNTRWQFLTDDAKLLAFQQWFQGQIDAGILEVDTGGAPWLATYVRSAYQKAHSKSFDQSRSVLIGDEITDIVKGEFLSEALNSPQAVSKLRLLYTRSFDQLRGMTTDMSTNLSRILAQGIADGRNPRVLARQVNKEIDSVSRKRALVITRTEIIHAHAEGQLDAFERLGVKEVGVQAEWETAGDGRVCPLCRPLGGIVLPVDKARGILPRHPSCVTGEMRVSADDVVAVMCTKYTGDIIEFVTENGRFISTTENHILLTKYGFVPAKFVYKGLDIVDASNFDSGINAPNNNADVPTISDVFTSILKSPFMSSISVPLSPEHLHGDGGSCDPKVNIVYSNSELWDDIKLGEIKKREFMSFDFVDIHTPLDSLSGQCLRLRRYALTFDPSNTKLRETISFLLGSVLHSIEHGLAAIPSRHIDLFQSMIDCSSATFKFPRQSEDTHPIFIEMCNLLRAEVRTGITPTSINHINSSFNEMSLDSLSFSLDHFANRVARESGFVGFDKVIDIKSRHVENLPVYDLTTISSLYQVNGLITSNCRCAFLPANIGETSTEQKKEQSEVRKAVGKSVTAETGFKTRKVAARESRWLGADL